MACLVLPSGAMKRLLFAALLFLATTASASAKEVIPFIENDYSKALTRARSEHLPLFVEAWAPW